MPQNLLVNDAASVLALSDPPGEHGDELRLEVRETLTAAVEQVLVDLADWCLLAVNADGRPADVVAAHRDPTKAELAHTMQRLHVCRAGRADASRAAVVRGERLLIPRVTEASLTRIAQSREHLRVLHELDPQSLIVVPLRAGGVTLGTMQLARDAARPPFGERELELAEDLAGRVALAVENASLRNLVHEAKRDAERALRRIGGLQAVTAALSQAVTPAAVAEVFVRQGTAAVGASGGFVRLLTPGGDRLELAAIVGYSREFENTYRSLPLTSSLPGAEVFRIAEARFFESAPAARTASPEFAREHGSMGHQAIAFVPLQIRERVIGVLALGFAEPRAFDPEDRDLLAALASQCAQALERARLYQTERTDRIAAEQANERADYLQALAAELARSLTSAEVADVVVAQGIASVQADAGALYVLDVEEKVLEIVSGRGSNRSLIEGWRRLPIDVKVASTDALRTLEPVFIESEDEMQARYPEAGKQRRGARAGVHIPLVASGGPLGVLFLGFTRPQRFSDLQRSFVLALGRQCAQALSRAQLYDAELDGRNRLSHLVERLRDGVLSFDRQGRIEFANSAARRMLLPAPLGGGGPVPDAWHGFPLRSFVADLFGDGAAALEARVVSQDGERVFDLTGIRPARTETALVVVSDVSERERRRRVEREFVANAAHELRTPLAAITSAIERLQAGAREIPEKRDRYLGHIQRESERLNRLASSLLVLARAQTKEEEPRREEIVLSTFLRDLFREVEVNADVELVFDCPANLVVQANHDLLEHVFLNLATNAARHTRAGQIRVAARAGDAEVTIEVADTGPGMAAEELERVFDRFYRGSSADGRAGFGLGLPIAAEASRAMGGRLELDSMPGEGTTARIVLPTVVPVAAI